MMEKRLDVAKRMAREVGAYVSERFHTGTVSEAKSDGSPVTEVDREAERRIRAGIREAFPDDAIIGEEHDDEEGVSGFVWYLDPIDGTTNFIWGVPLYAVSIAVVDAEDVLSAAVYLPELDSLYTAERGEGATVNDESITMMDRTHPHDRLLLHASCGAGDAKRAAHISLQDPRPTLRILGSGTASLCLVAAGSADGAIYLNQAPHDYLAGSLLIREAGGVARTAGSSDFQFTRARMDILFGTPETIDRVSEVYRKIPQS